MASEQRATPALVWTGAERPRIPSGEYTARCADFQGPQWVREYGRWGLCLKFRLDPDDIEICAFYSFGENRDEPKIGTRSKYFKDWVRANGGPPKHGQEMHPKVFIRPEIWYTVHVSDANKDGEGNAKDDALVYSRVDRIIEVKHPSTEEGTQTGWQAGSPF
jgi:hypothetical protein